MSDLNESHSYCPRCKVHTNALACPKCDGRTLSCSCRTGKVFVPTRVTLFGRIDEEALLRDMQAEVEKAK